MDIKTHVQALCKTIDSVTDWCGRSVSWLVLGMVLATFMIVSLLLFNIEITALNELVSYFHSLVFLVGASYTLKANGHVRVDILYTRMSARVRAWIDLLGSLLILIPLMVFIIWVSYPYIADAWAVKEASIDSAGLPTVYLLKSTIILMSVLLILQAIAEILRALLNILPANPVATEVSS